MRTRETGPARTRAAIPLFLWLTCMALVALGGYFFVSTRSVVIEVDWGFRGYPVLLVVPFATVGAVVASRRPENPIGWLFCVVGLFSGAQFFVEEFAVYASLRPGLESIGRVAEWMGHWLWLPGAALIAISVLLFPDGKFLSPGWRWVRSVVAGGLVLSILGFGFGSPKELGLTGDNPFEIESLSPASGAVMGIGMAILLVGFILAAASIVVRMKRARGDERQQLKWLVLGAAMLPVGNIIASAPLPSMVQNLGACALALFPVGAGIAVMKYRLYEIDVVINRALVYGTLTALLAITYLAIVVVLQGAFAAVTEGSDLAVAGSTLAVAALFSPFRRFVQSFIDHRFYRRKYDAVATLGAFAGRLRDEVDLETLTAELGSVIGATMQPAHVSVWLRPVEHGSTRAS